MTVKYHNEEWLRQKYVNEEMSLREIADVCGVTYEPIRQWLDRFNIDRRHSHDQSVDDESYKDEKWLRDRYWNDPKSINEIASMCGVSAPTISYWMDKFGVERRTNGQGTITRSQLKNLSKLDDEEWLRGKYCEDLMSAYQISELFEGASPSMVYTKLSKFGIETRGNVGKEIPHAIDKISNCEWLREKYVDENKSGPEIASLLDISDATVYYYLDRFGIDSPDPLEPLSYYGPKWEDIRKDVIEDNNSVCQGCGSHREMLDGRLEVHHIRPLREFEDSGDIDYSEANDPSNLVPLCTSCHRKWEGVELRPQAGAISTMGGE